MIVTPADSPLGLQCCMCHLHPYYCLHTSLRLMVHTDMKVMGYVMWIDAD